MGIQLEQSSPRDQRSPEAFKHHGRRNDFIEKNDTNSHVNKKVL